MAHRIIYPSKIICPRTGKIIHRPRLFSLIDEARKNAKVIWIAAPGGSGKTTLVSSYLEKRELAHCWHQIDEEDKDLATFFHYLGLSGKRAAPRRKKASPKLTPEYQKGLSAFTRHFFLDLSSRLKGKGLIVLDNFQLFSETDPVLSLFPCIADAMSEGVSLLVVSRHLPPAFLDVLRVKRQLSVIDAKLMRFAEEEWIAASRLFGTMQSTDALLSLHHKLDGWIAGLVLLPETADISEETNPSVLGIDVLDRYIAEQFLSSLDDDTSALLMKVCYMPHITEASAIAVSHIAQSKKLLAKLAQKNLFVLRQGRKGYTVHPLIKQYLKQRVEQTLSTEQLYGLRLLTAKALLDDGEYEAAADLLLELEAWEALIKVILHHAEGLFESGRIEPLQRYINALPETLSGLAWINYWKGKLITYKDVSAAFDYHETAFLDFMANGDAKGAYLTWHAVVSIICGTLLGGDRLHIWIKRYEALGARYPEPPKSLQKGAVDAMLLHAYFLSDQNQNQREQLRKRVSSEIRRTNNSPLRLKMMSSYVLVAAGSGVQEQDLLIFERLEQSMVELKDDPVLYLGTAVYLSIALWSQNAFEKQLLLMLRALQVAKESGVSVFDAHLHSHVVIAALGVNKIDVARKHLNILKENISEKDQVYKSLYLTCLVIAGTVTDAFESLEGLDAQFLHNVDGTHIAPFIIHHKLLYVYYLCVRKRRNAALVLHDDLLAYCQKMAFQGQMARCYLIYAKIFFDNGDLGRSDDYLEKGFVAARADGVVTCCHWPSTLMTWACQRALTLGVEEPYVKRYIERNYTHLLEPTSRCDRWPWPFRIYTFGRFEVKSEKKEFVLKRRAGKLLALLKTLVAARDQSLSHSALKETRYIDIDHDKLSQLLDTQIHRLRKYFGNEDTVLREADRVKLNLKYFWIDVLEFETLGKQKLTQENALAIVTRLQQLYRGEYLPDDDDFEVIAQRERYRNMYLAILFKCVDYFQEKPDLALAFCQNALVLEPLSEPLYRKLIAIHLSRGDRDIAEITLNQCRMMMKRYLDCPLSSETLSLLAKP